MSLKKDSLGLGFGLAITIGGAIGMGILRMPHEVATYTSSLALFLGVWIIGGIFSLAGVPALVELTCITRRSAGFYQFAKRAYGHWPYLAFLVGWLNWISLTAAVSIINMVIAEEVANILGLAATAVAPLALGITAIYVLVHARGVQAGVGAQVLTFTAKLLVFALIVGLLTLFGESGSISVEPVSRETGVLAGIMLALRAVIPTYGGWELSIYYGEELKNPRTILRSMFCGALGIIAIYLAMNLALLSALPLDSIAQEELAFSRAVSGVLGEQGGVFMSMLALIVMLSTTNACIMSAPRVMYSLASDGYMPQSAARVANGTPIVALLVTSVLVACFVLSDSFETVLTVLAVFDVTNYAIAYSAVFRLRKLEPDTERPYRAWGHPWSTSFALTLAVGFVLGQVVADLTNTSIAITVGLASYPVYRLCKR